MKNKFLIKIPDACVNEQTYVLNFVFEKVFGISIQIEQHANNHVEISRKGKTILVNADFYIRASRNWLSEKTLPKLPLQHWSLERDNIFSNCVDQNIPVLYGKPGYKIVNDKYFVNADLFGSIFFMLSRYEENINSIKDKHDRVIASSTIASRSNFLNRPIVNEYIEVIWFFLKKQWPNLKRTNRNFRKFITCDVDHIIDPASFSFIKTIKRFFARIFRDKLLMQAFKDLINFFLVKLNIYKLDSCINGIKKIIEMNSAIGNEVTFNFIPVQTSKDFDRNIIFETNQARKILRLINSSGHKIGFHPGYKTFNDQEAFRDSLHVFKNNLESLNISTNFIGGRQHYLRFDISKTPMIWEKMKLQYDSSLAYAEESGFRCGICYEFPMYDLISRKSMNLLQRPLIIMEGTIIDYEGLGYSEKAKSKFKYFKDICKQFNGDFTLLWHNSSLIRNEDVKIYEKLIED